jgi:hypothetical protein
MQTPARFTAFAPSALVCSGAGLEAIAKAVETDFLNGATIHLDGAQRFQGVALYRDELSRGSPAPPRPGPRRCAASAKR